MNFIKVWLVLLLLSTYVSCFGQLSKDVIEDIETFYTYLDTLSYPSKAFEEKLLTKIQEYEAKGDSNSLMIVRIWKAYYDVTILSLEPDRKLLNEITQFLENTTQDVPYFDILYSYQILFEDVKGNVKRAIALSEKIIATTKSKVLTIKGQFALINAYLLKGDYTTVQKQIDVCKLLIDEDKIHYNKYYTNIFFLQHRFYSVTSNRKQSLLYGEKTLQYQQKYKLLDPYSVSSIYCMVASDFYVTGFKQKAEEYLEEAQKFATENLKDTPELMAAFLYDLGMAYDEIDVKKAPTIYEACLEKQKSVGVPLLYQVFPMYALVQAYVKLEKYDKGEVWIKEIFAMLDKLEQEPFALWHIYYLHVQIMLETERLDEGLQLIEKYIKAIHPALDINNPLTYQMDSRKTHFVHKLCRQKFSFLSTKALNDHTPTNIQEAIKSSVFLLSLDSLYKIRLLDNEKEIQGYNDNNKYVLNTLINLYYMYLQNSPTDQRSLKSIFKIIETRKAETLLDALSVKNRVLPKAERDKQKEFEQQITVIDKEMSNATLNKDTVEILRKRLVDVQFQYDLFKKRIKKDYPKYTRLFYEQELISAKDVQSTLNTETAFIQYMMTKNYVFTYVITKEQQRVFRKKLPDTFDENITKYNKFIANPLSIQKKKKEELIALSHDLYKLLLKEVEPIIADKSILQIVPDNQLFYVPFETLLASSEVKGYNKLDFLLKKYQINYHYSGTILERLQKLPKVQNQSILAFAPIFEDGVTMNESTRSLEWLNDSLFRGIEGNNFTALPHTEREVNTIKELLQNKGQVNILMSKNATMRNLQKNLDDNMFQFVHIATHGLVNHIEPRFSALACYPNETEELLTASQIQNLNISTDLVVLSSCESGIGRLEYGEGLIALNRSFIYAGAKNVLFSLWKVNDKYSSELMIDFYKNYLKGQSYTAALRNAKLKMLENPITAQPRFWAPFVLIGQ